MAQLTQGGIVFGNGQPLTKDPMRVIVENLGTGLNGGAGYYPNTTSTGQRYVWSNQSGIPNNGRGALYGTYYTAVTCDKYGCTWTYGGQNVLTVTNITDSTMRINLICGVFSTTDDTYKYLVYSGGSQANSTTHSGGTLIIDSGNIAGNNQLRTTTVTRDIPANSSVSFWLYAGVLNGSNLDQLQPHMRASFNSWI